MNVTARPTRGSRLRPLLVGIPYLLSSAVFLTVFLVSRPRLPDPIATHFGGSGHADGFTSQGALLPMGLAMLLLPGVLFVVLAYVIDAVRPLVLTAYAAVGPLCYANVRVVMDNAGAETARDVRLTLWEVPAALALAAVTGGVGLLVTRGWQQPAPEARIGPKNRPGLLLHPGETAFWTHAQRSRGLGIAGLTLLVAGATIIPLTGFGPGVVLLGTGLLFGLFSGVRSTVDRHGLTVTMLWLPWPRLRIPLKRIVEANARDINAFRDMGGWGYRINKGRSGVVLRSGEALVVQLANGKEFVVTTDDAATAAALLNGLVERGSGHAAPTDRRG
ncbi:DUF1648 domain-containing protein [Streptomyces sp. ET3-23]|uniref:DUF1648 domain-containing protein n=1 Tax=Streptomyces sp. ET3-23 TaxID=2885643 RepID=UPI001D107611|nr:DUF1648 domain-containing protein [Streptomyces sp. ET3-23]MCC2276699.1 DUF1648 domain-containing protein [Streptomyces sp. ET3-23]